MLTSESSVNRSTHVVADLDTGKYRLLTPDEADQIQGLPKGLDGHWHERAIPLFLHGQRPGHRCGLEDGADPEQDFRRAAHNRIQLIKMLMYKTLQSQSSAFLIS